MCQGYIFTHLFQTGDVHAHQSAVPHMLRVILVGEEASYMTNEQLCLLFYRKHHYYLAVNLMRNC